MPTHTTHDLLPIDGVPLRYAPTRALPAGGIWIVQIPNEGDDEGSVPYRIDVRYNPDALTEEARGAFVRATSAARHKRNRHA